MGLESTGLGCKDHLGKKKLNNIKVQNIKNLNIELGSKNQKSEQMIILKMENFPRGQFRLPYVMSRILYLNPKH